MNNTPATPRLPATIVQMPSGHAAVLRVTHHPRNPNGHTLSFALTVPITLEINLSPKDLNEFLKAA